MHIDPKWPSTSWDKKYTAFDKGYLDSNNLYVSSSELTFNNDPHHFDLASNKIISL